MNSSSTSSNVDAQAVGAMSAAAVAPSWSPRPSDMSEMSEAQSRLFAEINARQNAVEHKDDFIDRQGYRIGDLCLLAKFDATSELTVMPSIYRLPGAPEGVKGLANLHGNVVPVFELARWFNVTHDPKATPMLLVLGYGEDAVGVVIDGLPERKRFSSQDAVTVEMGHARLARFTKAAFRDSAGIWMEFDDRRFFETFARRFAV
jgi:twitching motility protein PilI